jgi:lipopolysaccharide/colanic/teichoic acid biosynthesis glycosyltransferase
MKNIDRKRLTTLNDLTRKLSSITLSKRVLKKRRPVTYFKDIQRGFDLTVSLFMLLVLFPLFLVTAVAIRLESRGPILYSQKRVGKNGRTFKFYKFRSMVVDAEQKQKRITDLNESDDGVIFKIKKDPRITRTGRFIRRFSIDELPQLLNIIRGDMSLVGPRPALPTEVAQYTLEQRKRLHTTPGITCLWQVSGRSDIPFTGQVRLDLQYIRNKGLLTNLTILVKTIPAVISGKGAY